MAKSLRTIADHHTVRYALKQRELSQCNLFADYPIAGLKTSDRRLYRRVYKPTFQHHNVAVNRKDGL